MNNFKKALRNTEIQLHAQKRKIFHHLTSVTAETRLQYKRRIYMSHIHSHSLKLPLLRSYVQADKHAFSKVRAFVNAPDHILC